MKGVTLLITLLLAGRLLGQQGELSADSAGVGTDTLTLLQAFRKGTIHGHARYFFMTTRNREELSDYYANAVGGGLKYETAPFRRFQAGVSGFFIYNVGSSDLSIADPLSGQYNRYEIGLFDVEDPHNKHDIDRLEELYLKYNGVNGTITFGKQLVHTPFINPQDSRMRPTEVEGLYGHADVHAKLKLEGGWIYKVSPRSTVRWYSVARSVGIQSQGVNIDGSRGDYAGHIESKGVGVLGLTWKPAHGVQLKGFGQLMHNVFHTAFLQADVEKAAGAGKWIGVVQYIRQDVLGKGGHAEPSKRYFDPSNRVNVLGVRTGWNKGVWETNVNYTRIFKGGRFTMPREWGTEPLLTYLSRERSEGAGDVHAFMVHAKSRLMKERLNIELGYGHYYLPKTDNAALNKYGMPSYRHLKVMGNYKFDGTLEGLDLALLFVFKDAMASNSGDARYRINKVDMASYNLVLNYNF